MKPRRRSNDPPTLILMSLAAGPKHGHALLKDIEEFAGVKLGPGALYGAITRMEERGLIEPLESDDRRRPYQITAAGSSALSDSVDQMRELARVGEARLKSCTETSAEACVMPAEGSSSKDGPPSTGSVDDPRLRWYPRSWRAKYGDELTTLLDDEYGCRVPARIQLSLVSGGLRQWARQTGLTGGALPAPDGIRAGALTVLASWTSFVIAGASFAKFAEHFDQALPHSVGAHRVPDVAFTVLQAVAAVASILVVIGAILAVPAFVRFLRAGGWPSLQGHFVRAVIGTVVTVAVTVPLVVWANHLPTNQSKGGIHWNEVLFLVWAAFIVITLTLWALAAMAAGRRVEFSTAMLTAEAILAGAVALAMVIMVTATAVWWGAMAEHAPGFLNASPAGAPGTPWDLWLVATFALMVLGMGAAVIGVLREVRLWIGMRDR